MKVNSGSISTVSLTANVFYTALQASVGALNGSVNIGTLDVSTIQFTDGTTQTTASQNSLPIAKSYGTSTPNYLTFLINKLRIRFIWHQLFLSWRQQQWFVLSDCQPFWMKQLCKLHLWHHDWIIECEGSSK